MFHPLDPKRPALRSASCLLLLQIEAVAAPAVLDVSQERGPVTILQMAGEPVASAANWAIVAVHSLQNEAFEGKVKSRTGGGEGRESPLGMAICIGSHQA